MNKQENLVVNSTTAVFTEMSEIPDNLGKQN